ncbi:DUF695 domain-containing protein [Lutimonas halocynthiae]|uniref:DUF695 domain-containing protein n=1 Tax=Lutimonas halocynthiae TaxID=1446477 RepID=UPI0025B2939E|nr:DUF695 domain-containing protein [Lutimonas halocynthiae]MDN3641502.1 DUF695 domain-containing protein [Lutimonas halocynthiae]
MSLLSFKKLTIFFLTLMFYFSSTISSFAQDDWIEFVTMKKQGVMSITLDLSLDLAKPNYKNLLVVGGQFPKCLKNGFPSEEGLEDVLSVSDSAAIIIDKITPNRLVGFITYQCMGFDIFYVKDTVGLRSELTRMFKSNFSKIKPYVEIKRDKSWDYYHNYLYPQDFSAEFLVDQDYLHDLVLQGDDLKGLRKVNHWLYFKDVEKRNRLSKTLTKLEFSLDSIAYKKDKSLPYQLTVSRQDSIDPFSIYKLTTMMRSLSVSSKGQYDGWSTEVISKD